MKEYGNCTEDLHQLCDDILHHKIADIIMESTGVYWIVLCAILTTVRNQDAYNQWVFYQKYAQGKTDKKDAK